LFEYKTIRALNVAILKNVPMGRFAKVDEIANFAVFLCSDYNSYMTGQTIVVDGGFTAR
jgi:3-oxoacyl-[acyl-carrier protein] reductase